MGAERRGVGEERESGEREVGREDGKKRGKEKKKAGDESSELEYKVIDCGHFGLDGAGIMRVELREL